MAVAVLPNSEVGGVTAGYLRYRFRVSGEPPLPVRFVKRGSRLKGCLYVRNTAQSQSS